MPRQTAPSPQRRALPAPGASSGPPRRYREALAQQRRSEPAQPWGEPTRAAALARALEVGDEALDDHTHRFHSYPARLHPLTARRVIAALGLPRGAHLIDPFCGSGTVLVEGICAGLAVSGLDVSPLAVLVAQAKTWNGNAAARRTLVAEAAAIRDAVIDEGKAARRAGFAKAERETTSDTNRQRQQALSGWFDPHVRRELEALAAAIDELEPALAPLLRAVLSSILIKVSRRASDSRSETVARTVARGMASRLFADRAVELVRGLESLWKTAPPATRVPEIRSGDARAIPAPDDSFDAVFTSPPYAGTYDYADHHALRLAFLALPGDPIERREIGARRSFKSGPGGIEAWERDLSAVLIELSRVTRAGQPIIIVMGDSLAGTEAVYADQTIGRLAPAASLAVVAGASQPRLLLGRVERAAFAQTPKREHLIWLEKRATTAVRNESGPATRSRRSPSS